MSLFYKESIQFFLRQSHFPTIQPNQIRRLRADNLQLRCICFQEIIHIINVSLNVCQTLFQPFGTIAISSFYGQESKSMSQIKLTGIHVFTEFATKLVIKDNGMGSCQPRHVERLAWRHESNAIHTGLLTNHGKRTMLVRRQSQIGMNFIREHQYSFFITNVSHLLQFLFLPDNTTRIMRITKDEHLTTFDLCTEVLHIHTEHSILPFQRACHQSASVSFHQPTERMVNRRLDHHFVSFFRKGIQRHTDTWYNTRHKTNHFLLYLQAITHLIPSDNGFIIAIRLTSVSQHRIFTTLLDGFGDKRCRSKIHISYPKRNQVCSSPYFLHTVPLDG